MKLVSSFSSFILSALIATPAFAGGGGVARPIRSQTVSICKAVSGDLRGIRLYWTDAGGLAPLSTMLLIRTDSPKLDIYKELGRGKLNRDAIVGTHQEEGAMIDDLNEVIGYRSSGVEGDLEVSIAQIDTHEYRIDGEVKVTRAKNKTIDGPLIPFSGVVRCN